MASQTLRTNMPRVQLKNANSSNDAKPVTIDVRRVGPARHGAGHVGPRADRAGPPSCCGPRVRPMVRSVGHFSGPCRPFSPVPRAGPQPDKHIMSQFTNFFLTKINFFHKSQHMKKAAYNFIVSSKTYLNSQVISKRKSTESQHIEQNELFGPGRHWAGPVPCRGLMRRPMVRSGNRPCRPWPAITGQGRATDRAKINGPNVHLYQLPNCWTIIFHILPKQIRIASAFSKLLEKILEFLRASSKDSICSF